MPEGEAAPTTGHLQAGHHSSRRAGAPQTSPAPSSGRFHLLHIGGHRPPPQPFPLAARHADVWNVPTYGLEGWRRHQAVLDDCCAAIGRDPATLRRSHQAVLVLAADDRQLADALAKAERRYGGPGWGLHEGGYIGTPAQVVDRIGQSVQEGVSFFVFLTHDRADPRTLGVGWRRRCWPTVL